MQIKDERIKAVKSWLEPKLVPNIQVFIRFANIYWRFFQGFSKIGASLNFMLKTSSAANIQHQKSIVVDNEDIMSGSNLYEKWSKSKNPVILTVNTKQAFTQLRKAFTEVLIQSHFDLEYIWIETDASNYVVGSASS